MSVVICWVSCVGVAMLQLGDGTHETLHLQSIHVGVAIGRASAFPMLS